MRRPVKITTTSDWRHGIPFEIPVPLADINPGEATRCIACGADAAPRPRTELWAVKHPHPQHHNGHVRFYCSEHVPAPAAAPAAAPAQAAPRSRPRRAAAARTPVAPERPRAVCPNCFIEIPPTGVCGVCGHEA